MALDTFGDLKTYITRARRDTAYDHWTEAQTEDDLNLGIQWFCEQMPLATGFGTFELAPDADNAAEYVPPLGSDCDEIIHLQTGLRALAITTPADAFARDSNWDTATGTPIYYIPHYRRDSQERHVIRVLPIPDEALTDLKGEYSRVHPWLSEDTERLLIPIQYRIYAAAYALHLGYAADKQETQDLQKAAYWLGRAEEGATKARKKAARHFDRSPATVTLQR